jgi:hypothetical protein
MSAAASLAGAMADSAGSRLSAWPATWARGRRMLTWRYWAWATGLGVLVGALVPLETLHIDFDLTLWKFFYQTPIYVAFAWVYLLAIAAVEAPIPPLQWPSLWRYFSGAAAASVLCIGLAWALWNRLPAAPGTVVAGGTTSLTMAIAMLQVCFDGIVHGWFATFVYVGLRNARRAARSLSEAEMARAEANRSLLASRLEAARTEVDPAVVLESLEAVERSYESDPERAEGLLDELIAFLRGAIPRLRTEGRPPELEIESTSYHR